MEELDIPINTSEDLWKMAFNLMHFELKAHAIKDLDTVRESSLLTSITMSKLVLRDVKGNSDANINRIQYIRTHLLERFESHLSKLSIESIALHNSCSFALNMCNRQKHVTSFRLDQQYCNAEKRIKELVSEVIGEYGKSGIRVVRRHQFLELEGMVQTIEKIWHLQWDRFLYNLVMDSTLPISHADNDFKCDGLNSTVLCPLKDSVIFTKLENKLLKRYGAKVRNQKILTVIRLTKAQKSLQTLLPSSNITQELESAENPVELKRFSHHLRKWCIVQNRLGISHQASSNTFMKQSQPTKASSGSQMERNKLKSLLRSNVLERCHPPSMCSNIWDSIYTSNPSYDPLTKNFSSSQDEKLKIFVSKYSAQHSSFIANDKLYFCLEERMLASRIVNSAMEVPIAVNESEEASAVFGLLKALQEEYCSHIGELLLKSGGDERHECVRNLIEIRKLLSTPLVVIGSEGKHRKVKATVTSSRGHRSKSSSDCIRDSTINILLKSFPDVIKVRAWDGTTELTFAPAVVANLPETLIISRDIISSLTSDQVRIAIYNCPHPLLPTLCLSKQSSDNNLTSPSTTSHHLDLSTHILEKLYCLTNVPILKSFDICNKGVADESNGFVDNILQNIIGSNFESNSSCENSALDDTSTKNVRKFYQLMLPLEDICYHELFRHYLWSPSILPSAFSNTDLSSNENQAFITSRSGLPLEKSTSSSVDEPDNLLAVDFTTLLPDHARLRNFKTKTSHGVERERETKTNPDNSNNDVCSDGSSESVQTCALDATSNNSIKKFYHKYFLIGDSYSESFDKGNNGHLNQKKEFGVNNNGESGQSSGQCYYLVQAWDSSISYPDQQKIQHLMSKKNPTSDYMLCPSSPKICVELNDEDIILHDLLLYRRGGIANDTSLAPTPRPLKSQNENNSDSNLTNFLEPDPSASSTGSNIDHTTSIPLFHYLEQGESTSSQSNILSSSTNKDGGLHSSKRRGWDVNVLSTVCRWRACMCDSSILKRGREFPTKQYLCHYHEDLKTFLDSQKYLHGCESSKYLPGKAPIIPVVLDTNPISPITITATAKRDLLIIRAASTLLQELWDGKLRATVKSFTKKVSADMNFKDHMGSYLTAAMAIFGSTNPALAALPPPPTSPIWAVWKDRNVLERVLLDQTDNQMVLEKIQHMECAVTRELEGLMEHKVFPSTELAVIRREMKCYKEQQDERMTMLGKQNRKSQYDHNYYQQLILLATLEQRVSEKKLSLLSIRHQEEIEAKLHQIRKENRKKDKLEDGGTDMNNFRFR